MPASKAKVKFPRAKADKIIKKVEKHIKPFVDRHLACGSYRRGAQMVGDIDFVIIPKAGVTLPQMLPPNDGINWVGDNKAQVIIDGEKVDFKVTTPDAWGATILYFTGPADFNIKYRWMAKKRGMKLNEYGLWDRATDAYIAGASEQDIYDVLKRPFRDPDQRTGWKAEGNQRCNAVMRHGSMTWGICSANAEYIGYCSVHSNCERCGTSLIQDREFYGRDDEPAISDGHSEGYCLGCWRDTEYGAETFGTENQWIVNNLTMLLTQRARTLKELIDELGIRGITVESNLVRNPTFVRVRKHVPAVYGLKSQDYNVRYPYGAISPSAGRKQHLKSMFEKLDPREKDWDDDVTWETGIEPSGWSDEVEWDAENYENISLEDMDDFLKRRRFKPVDMYYRRKPVKEWVYERKLPNHANHFIRVYTSIQKYGRRTDQAREVGKDAIRVQVIYRDGKGETLVSMPKRVNRIASWKKNLDERMNEIAQTLPTVAMDSRGEPMTLRKKKGNLFWGSRDYPAFKETRRYGAEEFRSEEMGDGYLINIMITEYMMKTGKNYDVVDITKRAMKNIDLPTYEFIRDMAGQFAGDFDLVPQGPTLIPHDFIEYAKITTKDHWGNLNSRGVDNTRFINLLKLILSEKFWYSPSYGLRYEQWLPRSAINYQNI